MHRMAVADEAEPWPVLQTADEFPLRDQTEGRDERVTGDILPLAAVQMLGRHAADQAFAVDLPQGHTAAQRDGKGLDAAVIIARHAAVSRLPLQYGDHVSARERKVTGHDHSQIAAAEDQDLVSERLTPQIDHFLRLPGGVDPGRTRPCDGKRADRLFPTAGGKDQMLKAKPLKGAPSRENGDLVL